VVVISVAPAATSRAKVVASTLPKRPEAPVINQRRGVACM
jgi:hypothetical protein